jgi:hypothetical protein
MKKFIVPALCLALVVPVLSGCSVSKEHKNLYNEWVAFSSDVNYTQFLSGNINFSSEIITEKNKTSSPYYTLSYCEKIIELSLQNINQFYGLFQVTPQYHKHQTRTLCFNTQNKLEDFKEEVEIFNANKQNLESTAHMFGVNHDASLTELQDFMVYIGNLAVKANNLQVSFTKALASLYSLPIDRETAGTSLDVETSINQVQSRLIDDYVQYAIIKQNMVHPNSTNNLYSALIALDNKLKNFDCLTTSYAQWLNSYRLFEAEETMFKKSLKHVDLLQDNSSLSGNQKLHYQKVQSFVDSNAELFVNKTITLLY